MRKLLHHLSSHLVTAPVTADGDVVRVRSCGCRHVAIRHGGLAVAGHFAVVVGAIVFACADLGTARTVGDFYWLDLVSRVIDTFTSGWLRQSIGVCGRCLGIA